MSQSIPSPPAAYRLKSRTRRIAVTRAGKTVIRLKWLEYRWVIPFHYSINQPFSCITRKTGMPTLSGAMIYNRQRRQARLGFLSPAAYTQKFYAEQLAA